MTRRLNKIKNGREEKEEEEEERRKNNKKSEEKRKKAGDAERKEERGDRWKAVRKKGGGVMGEDTLG